jgi:beta-galactosidase
MKNILSVLCILTYSWQISLSQEYKITIAPDLTYLEDNHFKQGTNTGPDGKKIELNNHFFTYGGIPILPVIGEFHYTRYPRENWEEAILKMKAAGINVIASYNFWISHEQDEGKFRFDGNRDVRYFLELCKKHHLWAFMRIGPWSHGEARNGGYPDWYQKLIKQKRIQVVNNLTRPYISRFYQKLAEQFTGLYFKDGGPIIAIQIDNEVNSKGKGEQAGMKYISDLKQLAVSAGMDAPIYSATGWSGNVPEDDVMPTYGGYPDAPWDKSTRKLPPSPLYTFTPSGRADPNVGTDLGLNASDAKEKEALILRHPFFTVEMGAGNQDTYHRRPTFVARDMIALIYTRLGVGANAIGYYMFHGGQQPISDNGKYTTNESTTTLFPYPNDVPLISYDFLAPISEWGFAREYYHDFKLINTFTGEFGAKLAPMYASLPTNLPAGPSDTTLLRYAVRSKAGEGFLFINNHTRHLKMPAFTDIRIAVQLPSETIYIPEKSMNISSGAYAIFPFNMPLDDICLKYATAHPLAVVNDKSNTFFFYDVPGTAPEFKFDALHIKSVKAVNGKVIKEKNSIFITNIKPGTTTRFTIKTTSKKILNICVLPYEMARHVYKTSMHQKEYLFITDKTLLNNESDSTLEFLSMGEPAFTVLTFPEIKSPPVSMKKQNKEGIFRLYALSTTPWQVKEKKWRQVSTDKDFDNLCYSLKSNPTTPSYTHLFDPKKKFLTYELSLPPDFLSGVNNVYLHFNYWGNTAMIFARDTLRADDFYNGLPMIFGCAQHRELLNEKLLFQISPLMPHYAMYFEDETPLSFASTVHARLNSIKAIPEYKISLKY